MTQTKNNRIMPSTGFAPKVGVLFQKSVLITGGALRVRGVRKITLLATLSVLAYQSWVLARLRAGNPDRDAADDG